MKFNSKHIHLLRLFQARGEVMPFDAVQSVPTYRLIGYLPDGTRDVICSEATRDFVEWAREELRHKSSYVAINIELDPEPADDDPQPPLR